MTEESREYFIYTEKGKIPQKLRPLKGQAIDMCRELVALHGAENVIHVDVRKDDLWLTGGGEYIFTHEAYEEMARHEEAEERRRAMMFTFVERRYGADYRKAVEECLKDAGYISSMKIVPEPCKEADKQKEDWGAFDHTCVNQYRNGGYSGDDYAGYLYIPLPSGKYIEAHYSQ